MCCYSGPVKRKAGRMSSVNLVNGEFESHRDFLLVNRWAAKMNLTLDDLHEDMGARAFAESCGIGDAPLGVVEEIRVERQSGRVPLVVIAESRGYSVARFVIEHFLWLKEFYGITKSDAPEEQEGWVETTGEILAEMRGGE